MTALGLLSVLCLTITGLLATWGVFSRHFDDNLSQCVGLSTVAIACFLRIPAKLDYPYTPPELLLAQIGLCAYAVGTAVKLWRASKGKAHHRRRRGLSRWLLDS